MEVSVVVATYGDESWRSLAQERAVPSALAQSSPALEVITVHGDSLHEARNCGAEQAKSEALVFLDADDELHPDYLEHLTNATGDLRGPAVQYVRGTRRQAPYVPAFVEMSEGNWLVIGTLVRKAMFLEVGGFRDWDLYEDWDLWQRCWLKGATIEAVPEAVYIAHARRDSRNRGVTRAQKLEAHHAIRRANMPELYEEAS